MGIRVYLAGKMSGLPDHGFPAFRMAASQLRAAGHDVVSPAEMDEEEGFDEKRAVDVAPGTPEYAAFMARDVRLVAEEDIEAVVVLPNWHDSTGARLEVHVAQTLGKPVLTFPTLEPLPTEPSRHPNSARFHTILAELGGLHDRKQADYGRGDDPFANVRAAEDFGVPGWIGVAMRMNDKMKRLQTAAAQYLATGEVHLANEGVVDAFDDSAVYAVIGRVLFEEQADN